MAKIKTFQKHIWDFYRAHKRAMPWRDDVSPYSIFVSEVMLQQTQVARVLVKYPLFTAQFPSFVALAGAHTPDVLRAWQGMGYNRRALSLKKTAQIIVEKYGNVLPSDPLLLDELPGIGYATACSIAAFAYNKPVVFVETNIRRVFIHHFFSDKQTIDDTDILPFVKQALDTKKPREWYWALMDYGAYLATQIKNPNVKSKHYVIQKKFEGSVRQVRGGIIKLLLKRPHSMQELNQIYKKDGRLLTAIEGMVKEGMIREKDGAFEI